MTYPVDPSAEGPHFPENFSVNDLETLSQRLLRVEFARLEILNQFAIDNFDPNSIQVQEDIGIATPYKEYELAEPQLTKSLQTVMLRRNGLEFRSHGKEDTDTLFEYNYKDGEVRQIRLLTRDDEVKVPVYTVLGSNKDGNPIKNIRLLSNDLAEKEKQRLEDLVKKGEVNKRLKNEFGLEEKFLDLAGLSLQDKHDMLAAYDEIQKIEVLKPDQGELKNIRNKLTRNMMPRLDILGESGDTEKTDMLMWKYSKQLKDFSAKYGLDKTQRRELLESEQLLRLSNLNKQLKSRRRILKAGTIAAGSILVGVGATVGAFDGVAMHQFSDKPVKEGLVGGAIGLALAIQKAAVTRRRLKMTQHGFSVLGESYANSTFKEQLKQESNLARAYGYLLSYGT